MLVMLTVCKRGLTLNTYDWIIAGAASRIRRRGFAVIITVNNVCLIDGPLFPVRLAVTVLQFGVKHPASVPGRIRLLIVSMITINGINMVVLKYVVGIFDSTE